MAYKYYDDDYEQPSLYEDDVEHAKDHLQGLIQAVYNTGSMEDLERHLEEVLGVFGMNIPQEKPVLMKPQTSKEKSTERALQAWVGYTRAYADMLTNNPIKL